MRNLRLSRALFGVAVAAALVGCSVVPDFSAGALRSQAQAMLDAWDKTVSGSDPSTPVFIGDLTGQLGDWEETVGENNKEALYAGLLVADGDIPDTSPPADTIRWPDGRTQDVQLLSAADALREISTTATITCTDCQPMKVTAAKLASGTVETSRGPAEAPVWQYTLRGTAVVVTRVAVAERVRVVPPPWNADNPPQGISIEKAIGRPDGQVLTVSFLGAPGPGSEPCGADYSAEAVESRIAVVVIVHEQAHVTVGGCTAVGAARSATVTLAAPLGDRVVLEVKEGLPIPVVDH